MRHSSLNWTAFIFLLGFLFCLPMVLSAQGQARCFVARINESPHKAEMTALNQRIAGLERKLRTVGWPGFDQAEYKLVDTFIDEDGGQLELTAGFMSPKISKAIPKTGRSEPSDNLEYRIETALADLLNKTLLDPDLGPYGFLRVEKCVASKKEYVLTVRPPAHVILDDTPAYELGEAKLEGGATGLRIFFRAETVTSEAGGATKINFVNFSKHGNDKIEDICRSASPNSAVLLLVRYSIPKLAEGSSHGNLSRF